MARSAGESEPTFGWSAKVLVLGGATAISFAMSVAGPVLPKIEKALAHTAEDATLVKMLIGIVSVAVMIGAPLNGFLCDRIGLKPIFFGNYLLFTVAGSTGLFIDDLHILVFTRFLLGLGAAGAITASIIMINTRLPTDQRPGWMGASISVAMHSGIVMRPLSGLLGEHDWHWVFSLYLLGAPFVVASLWFKDVRPVTAAPSADAAPAPSLLKWFPYRFILVALTLGTLTYLPTIYVPFQLRDMGIDSPTKISFVLMGDTLTAAAAAILYGRARRYLSERGAFTFSFTAATIGLLVTALAPNYEMVMVGMAIFGIAVAWFMPNMLIALGTRVRPEQQGRAAGLVKAANYLAPPLCILFAEPIARRYGSASAVMIAAFIAFLSLAAVIVHMFVRRPAHVREAVA